MKNTLKKIFEISLLFRIAMGLVIGIILALIVPGLGIFATLGSLFVGALKAIAPILVFILIMSSLANASFGIGARFRTVICLYMLSTLLAAVLAVVASFLFPITVQLGVEAATDAAPGGVGEVMNNLITNMVGNPVNALLSANYISILFWSIMGGLALKGFASDETKRVIADIAEMVSTMVRWIIQLAPIGIMGIIYTTLSESGFSVFADYGKLVLVLVGCMLFGALITNAIVCAIFLKRNPYPLIFRCLKDSGLTAFFTRSSAANIPVNMELCEKLGLDRDFYSVSIPLGATINMDGAAITITIMTLAAAHTLGIQVDFASALLLSLMATVSACGASGVAGGSLLLIPMACSLFGIDNDVAMQMVSIGFIIGVIQDSMETALNSSGDVLFTATAEFHDMMKRGEKVSF